MSNYCFASVEEQQMLFAEAALRGWVAAVQDWPHLKSREECAVPASAECDVLKAEVCCITDERAYQQFVSSAWIGFYVAFADASERQAVQFAAGLKSRPADEALKIMRYAVSSGEGLAQVETYRAQAN